MLGLCAAVASNKDVEALLCGNEPEAVSWVSLQFSNFDERKITHSLFCASAHSRTQPLTPPLILCGARILL